MPLQRLDRRVVVVEVWLGEAFACKYEGLNLSRVLQLCIMCGVDICLLWCIHGDLVLRWRGTARINLILKCC